MGGAGRCAWRAHLHRRADGMIYRKGLEVLTKCRLTYLLRGAVLLQQRDDPVVILRIGLGSFPIAAG